MKPTNKVVPQEFERLVQDTKNLTSNRAYSPNLIWNAIAALDAVKSRVYLNDHPGVLRNLEQARVHYESAVSHLTARIKSFEETQRYCALAYDAVQAAANIYVANEVGDTYTGNAMKAARFPELMPRDEQEKKVLSRPTQVVGFDYLKPEEKRAVLQRALERWRDPSLPTGVGDYISSIQFGMNQGYIVDDILYPFGKKELPAWKILNGRTKKYEMIFKDDARLYR